MLDDQSFTLSAYIPSVICRKKGIVFCFELVDSRIYFIKMLACRLVVIIPSYGFICHTAVFGYCSVGAMIDTVIITQLSKLPNHFWTGERNKKSSNSLLSR